MSVNRSLGWCLTVLPPVKRCDSEQLKYRAGGLGLSEDCDVAMAEAGQLSATLHSDHISPSLAMRRLVSLSSLGGRGWSCLDIIDECVGLRTYRK
jgi:hypothetical protein